MASLVTDDGHVIPPLNISAPAPLINLRGFHWDTVDKAIHGPQPGQEEKEDETAQPPQDEDQGPILQSLVADQEAPRAQAAGPGPIAVPKPVPLPAPQQPLSPEALGTQLPTQLGLEPGRPAAAAPLFPLAQFQGAYAGNGFNMIFRPRPRKDTTRFPIKPVGPDDNVLELNLTTEQLTFGRTIGKIPNRGLNLNDQPDIDLGGFPYLQTVQDVTNPVSGKGDRADPIDIHFEPGMFLNVPASKSPQNGPSVVRMASIPHGTTINAQGLSPPQQANTTLGGFKSGPKFETIDTTPFTINNPSARVVGVFQSMDANKKDTPRIPQNLDTFIKAGTINTDIIKNPNLVLQRAIQGQDIRETIVFEVSTGQPDATLNGGGTANISFLAGTQKPITNEVPDKPTDKPNAHAALMTSTFWIETVAYEVNVPRLTKKGPILLKPTMPKDSTAPTPIFAIAPPPKLPSEPKKITVPGIQIQYTQTVNLNFATLTWPHVSVATLVPTGPQPFQMT